jgi:hypothetical protein
MYAQVFKDFATPRALSRCGGWILERQTPSLHYRDAMGCYPLFACSDWSQLSADIDSLDRELVSITLVTDPFGSFQQEDLLNAFDGVKQFKAHLITDLKEFPKVLPGGTTRRNVSKALANLDLALCPKPNLYIDEWNALYAGLCKQHGIVGIRAFSKKSFESLFKVPGLTMLRASHQNITVGLHLWMTSGNVAYGHLGATSQLGNKFKAAYALYWFAINTFREQFDWLDLGSATGLQDNQVNGLLNFKRRWATGTRPVYLCSRILNQDKYVELSQKTQQQHSNYFPAYRSGEFQ